MARVHLINVVVRLAGEDDVQPDVEIAIVDRSLETILHQTAGEKHRARTPGQVIADGLEQLFPVFGGAVLEREIDVMNQQAYRHRDTPFFCLPSSPRTGARGLLRSYLRQRRQTSL